MSDASTNGRPAAGPQPPPSAEGTGKGAELRAFIGLSVFLAPALTVALVGALGFGIWIAQLIFGPPGPQG